MKTYTIGDSFTMASIPMRYPDAKMASELLVNKEDIKGIWISGEESHKYYEKVLVVNNQIDEKLDNMVIKNCEVIEDEKQ